MCSLQQNKSENLNISHTLVTKKVYFLHGALLLTMRVWGLQLDYFNSIPLATVNALIVSDWNKVEFLDFLVN